MSAPLRFGLAGTGRMAATMLRTVRAVPGAEIVGVASADRARARAFAEAAGVPQAFGSVEEMVAQPDIDGLYVAGRTGAHFAAAMTALAAGKPVLVEKPLAATLEDARSLVETARAQGTLLMENLWCLTLPAYHALADDLSGGDYGDPVQLTFDFGYPVMRDAYPSLFDSADGGALRDRGVYGVALALHLLGPVTGMTAALQRDAAGTDLAAAVQLRHQSGAVSQVAVALNALLSNVAAIACTKGLLRLESPVIGAETLFRQRMVPVSALPETGHSRRQSVMTRLKEQPLLRRINGLRRLSKQSFLSYGTDPYAAVFDHFCALIRAGRSESETIGLNLSLETHKILHQALVEGTPQTALAGEDES